MSSAKRQQVELKEAGQAAGMRNEWRGSRYAKRYSSGLCNLEEVLELLALLVRSDTPRAYVTWRRYSNYLLY
jgi:hypothetical protein